MTGLLIVLGLVGEPVFAANVAIVQAATLALFYAFSGNSRNLILNHESSITAQSILNNRLILLLPLAAAAYWLSAIMASVPSSIVIVLILRRSVEWFDEIYLSEMERLDVKKSAFRYTILQAALLVISLLWLTLKLPFPLFGLLLWALLPLVLSVKFYCKNISNLSYIFMQGVSRKLLPHIGSTMIIGVAVYVFRLLIILVVGKSTAGDLFTAFAIGGVLGSVFANAIGPSLALHQKRNFNYQMPTIIKLMLMMFLSVGLILTALSAMKFEVLALSGKTFLFWQATGLSMVAGTIMVFAQMIRHRLLQHHQEQDLFGPDVMINILIIIAVPFCYYLFGLQMLSALYLLSALLAYSFYVSYEFGEGFKSGLSPANICKLKIVIATMLFIPLFFQIHGGVFNDKAMVYDSKGGLSLLPIPLSVLGCFLGVLLLGNYQQAKLSFTFIFITFILMTFATIITTGQQALLEESKFIFLIQFVMPMFGLVLGQFFYQRGDDSNNLVLEKTLFFMLLTFIPLQLTCTWLQGYNYLSPYLYFMSIYQHLQYVPVIFVSVYLLAFVGLWDLPKYRVYLFVLMFFMSVYVVASLSVIATLLFYVGMFGFGWYRYKKDRGWLLPIGILLGLLISFLYFSSLLEPNVKEKNSHLIASQNELVETMQVTSVLPLVFAQHLPNWKYYYHGITNNAKSVIFGHAARPDRNLHPSAYNYYLDFIYNFGLLAMIPLLWLGIYTLKQINLRAVKANIDESDAVSLFVLSGVVLFLLLVDNSFKVSLRQPYSGIIIFFLWGLLISKLSNISKKATNVI